MGERGNIKVDFNGNDAVYFYTHWTGYRVQHDLANALNRGRGRWTDGPYLARIVFSEMLLVPGNAQATYENLTDTTGFGIDTEIGDNSYDIPEVSVANQEVSYQGRTYSFEEFVDSFGDDGS